MEFFRELRQCIKYLRRKSWRRDITFYAEHAGYFPYFEGILRELLGGEDISIAYITSDSADPILQEQLSGMSTFHVRKLLPFLFLMMNTRVCVMTMPDLDRFYLKKSLRARVHYVYLFHSLISTHMQYREGAFDAYDSIFCAGPHHRREIRAREMQKKLYVKNLVEAGYYRLERIYDAYRGISKHTLSKPCVLVAPSWGKDNILESCGEEVVQILLDAGYVVIVRPHPEVVRHSPEILIKLKEKFLHVSEFTLEMSVRTDDSLLRADVLVTDWSGIAFEYALGTKRPVLFINVPKKVHNTAFEELNIEPIEIHLRKDVGVVIEVEDILTLPEAITHLIHERSAYERSLAKLRDRIVFSFGQSSKKGGDALRALLND